MKSLDTRKKILLLYVSIISAGALNNCSPQGLDSGVSTIYREDDRKELKDSTQQTYTTAGKSTALLIATHKLLPSDTGHMKIMVTSYGESQQLCRSERFHDQPSAGHCSGFLIADNLLVTAGHCLSEVSCENLTIAFDYALTNDNQDPSLISKGSIFRCDQVLEHTVDFTPHGRDLAVIRLDRKSGRKPLTVHQSGSANAGDKIAIAGHPAGLPLKIADNATITGIAADQGFFYADLDSFHASSGSPVFNTTTGIIEGILARGTLPDYAASEENGKKCFRAHKVSLQNGAEEVIEARNFAKYGANAIGAYDPGANPPAPNPTPAPADIGQTVAKKFLADVLMSLNKNYRNCAFENKHGLPAPAADGRFFYTLTLKNLDWATDQTIALWASVGDPNVDREVSSIRNLITAENRLKSCQIKSIDDIKRDANDYTIVFLSKVKRIIKNSCNLYPESDIVEINQNTGNFRVNLVAVSTVGGVQKTERKEAYPLGIFVQHDTAVKHFLSQVPYEFFSACTHPDYQNLLEATVKHHGEVISYINGALLNCSVSLYTLDHPDQKSFNVKYDGFYQVSLLSVNSDTQHEEIKRFTFNVNRTAKELGDQLLASVPKDYFQGCQKR